MGYSVLIVFKAYKLVCDTMKLHSNITNANMGESASEKIRNGL
jgi:hypothetical protein